MALLSASSRLARAAAKPCNLRVTNRLVIVGYPSHCILARVTVFELSWSECLRVKFLPLALICEWLCLQDFHHLFVLRIQVTRRRSTFRRQRRNIECADMEGNLPPLVAQLTIDTERCIASAQVHSRRPRRSPLTVDSHAIAHSSRFLPPPAPPQEDWEAEAGERKWEYEDIVNEEVDGYGMTRYACTVSLVFN